MNDMFMRSHLCDLLAAKDFITKKYALNRGKMLIYQNVPSNAKMVMRTESSSCEFSNFKKALLLFLQSLKIMVESLR